jgi:hypothetical protein
VSTNLLELRDEMISEVALYKTPITYTNTLYNSIITKASKNFYIDTGRENSWATQYSVISSTPTLSIDLTLTEREYIVTLGQIVFIDQIKSDVAKLVSYSTDSLSVTQGDKPYRNLSEDRKNLENRLLELFYKLPNVSTMTSVTSLTITEIDVTYK